MRDGYDTHAVGCSSLERAIVAGLAVVGPLLISAALVVPTIRRRHPRSYGRPERPRHDHLCAWYGDACAGGLFVLCRGRVCAGGLEAYRLERHQKNADDHSYAHRQ